MIKHINTVSIDLNSAHGKLVVVTANAAFEFSASDKKEFEALKAFKSKWVKNMNSGSELEIKGYNFVTTFNARSIVAMDLINPS